MKKLFSAALFAALALSFTACGDSDSCTTPIAINILSSLNSMTTVVDTTNLSDATKAETECTAFAEELKKVVDANDGIDGAAIKADWESQKNSSFLCGLSNALYTAIGSLDFATKYKTIQDNTTYCTSAVVAGVTMATDDLIESTQTMAGWHDILQSAADATAQEANKK